MRLGASLNVALAALSLLCAPAISFAEDAISATAQKTIGLAKVEIVPSLIVLNSAAAKLEGTTLTLSGVSPNSIIFADRPVRSAGHSLTAHLLEEWTPGSGSFDKDPPNATVSVLSKDASTVSDAVVVLKEPVPEQNRAEVQAVVRPRVCLAANDQNDLAGQNDLIVGLSVQDYYTGRLYGAGDADANSVLLRGTMPHKLGGHPQIVRATLPVVTTPDVQPVGRRTGLGDLNLFDLFLFKDEVLADLE